MSTDDELRKALIEKYMDIAASFFFEGSFEEDEREDSAPKFADEVIALFARHTQNAEHYRLEGALWILNQLHKSPSVTGRSMEVIESMRQETAKRLRAEGEK